MNATFYSFYKKKNSTAQPSDSGITVDIKLKDNVSVMNPVFIMQNVNARSCNYFKWNNRYYFVTDFIYVTHNLYEVHGTIDTLATYKSQISNYSCFVERCADSNYYDTMINDNYVSQKQSAVFKYNRYALGGGTSVMSEGSWILRAIGQGTTDQSPCVATYVLSTDDMKYVFNFLYGESNYGDLLADASVKVLFDPLKYVISVTYIPMSRNYWGTPTGTDTVKLGWFDTGRSCVRLYNEYVEQNHLLTFPSGLTYSDWRKFDSAFCKTQLYLPGAGMVDIDPYALKDGIWCTYTINANGNVDYVLRLNESNSGSGSNTVIQSVSGNLGVQIQLTQARPNFEAMVTAATAAISATAGTAASIASLDFGGGVERAANGLRDTTINAVASMQPIPTITGSQDSPYQALNWHDIILMCRQMDTGSIPTSRLGKPCCKNVQLGNLSGYIKCAGASINAGVTDIEKNIVNGFLNQGFYME